MDTSSSYENGNIKNEQSSNKLAALMISIFE